MAINLLNPACGSCNDCCTPCDYYDPVQWYAVYCNIKARFMGLANASGSPGGPFAYYATHSLHTDLMAVLLNWQFDLSQPYFTSGDSKNYLGPLIPIPSLDTTLEYHSGPVKSGLTPPEDPVRYFDFENWEAQVEIRDICGQWNARVTLWCDVYEGATQFDRPATGTVHAVAASGSISTGAPQVSCGNAYTSTLGGFASSMLLGAETLIVPLGTDDPDINIKVQADNSMLVC